MRRRLLLPALFTVLLSYACADQSTGPGALRPNQDIAPSDATCTIKPVAEIQANLTLLMAYVVPNDNSTLGKFQGVVDAVNAGDLPLAQSRLTNLLNFINLKYGQLSLDEQNIVISEPLAGGKTVAQFKDMVVADLICFLSFDLNPGDPAKVFTTPDGLAGVWFPANYVPVGTNVEITNINDEPGNPLVTPFDQYGTFVRIKLVPEPALLNGTPVVVVCFPTGLPTPVAERLLLGAQHVPNDASGFNMYEQVEEIPEELAGALVCGLNGGLDVAYSPAEKTLRKALEYLLPKKLHAAFFAQGGVGGSPEEFSEFGAIDPQVTARGGAGGSPEEFLKAQKTSAEPATKSSKATPATASVEVQSADVIGQVGNDSTGGLPSVVVETPGGGTPVPGVKVTFTLSPAAHNPPPGNAHFCGAFPPDAVEVFTNASGEAELPCIHFGSAAGYSNLMATVDGSSLGYDDSEGNSLVIVVSQGSTSDNDVNFLIQATSGPAAKFTLVSGVPSSAQAGAVFSPAATLQLRDANDNLVAEAGVSATAALGLGEAGALAGTLTEQTDATGLVTFDDLRINGVIGARTIQFTSAYPTVAGGTVTITTGNAAKLAMFTEPAGAQAGILFTTQPAVKLQDAFSNDVTTSGVAIGVVVTPGGGGTLAGTLSANTVNGVATFTNLQIDGLIGARTLDFSSSGLTGVSSASFSVTAGNATALAINTQPSANATAGALFGQQPAVGLRDAFGNVVTSPQVTVTAAITAGGAGTLAGTLSQATVGGMATFTDLQINGLVGSRTLDFTSTGLSAVTSTGITIGAGTASLIKTFMPAVAPDTATAYSYGAGLPVGPVSFAPRVKVTDTWGNPVGLVGVSWTPLVGSNGAALVLPGGGSITDGTGLAQATSWSIGDGANQVTATITGGTGPATFTGTGPTGQIQVTCALGASKADIGWLTFKTPAGTVRTINLWMSVTGQSSSIATYPATIKVYKNGPAGVSNPLVGEGAGGVTLPGNNGTPTPVTFTLFDPAFASETGGVANNNVLWVLIQFPGLSPTRKIQVWYQNVKKPLDDCVTTRVYNPGSTNVSKQALSIIVTN